MAGPRAESPVQALPLLQSHHKLAFYVSMRSVPDVNGGGQWD